MVNKRFVKINSSKNNVLLPDDFFFPVAVKLCYGHSNINDRDKIVKVSDNPFFGHDAIITVQKCVSWVFRCISAEEKSVVRKDTFT